MKTILQKWYLYIIGLALITVCVFASFLFNPESMLFGSDTLNGLDAREFQAESIRKDHQLWPTWFNSRLSGMPTMDALFADEFYPPTTLLMSVFPAYKALGLRLVLHVFLAGMFFFLLLRKGFSFSPFIAFIGAVLYMLNPQFLSHVYPGHDGKMFVIAWLPFVVWMLKSLLEKPKLLTATLLALGIAICLYTSHIQLTYFVLIGLFLYWLVHSVRLFMRERKFNALISSSIFFWCAVLGGMALALPQLYPSFMYIRDGFSVRGVERGFDYAASWSLHWPEFFSMWVPEFVNTLNNYWGENAFKLNSEYAGLIATLLAVLAIVHKRNAWRIFWGAFCGLALLFSLGAHTPVFHIAYYLVPGIKKFRACSMVMFWFSFGTILLSCLFLKDVVAGEFAKLTEEKKKAWKKGILIAIGAITVVAMLFSVKDIVASVMQRLSESLSNPQKTRIFDENFSKNFVPFLWLWWVFAAGLLGLLWGVVAGKVNTYAFCAVVLAIGLIDTLRVDGQFITTVNPRPYFYSEPSLVDLKGEMSKAPFRCFTLPGALSQNAEGVHSLEGVGGFHDNELNWYRKFRGDQQDRNFFDKLIGAGPDGRPYLVADNLKNGNGFLNLANARYYLIRQGQDLLTIKNEGALDRISFAANYVVIDSSRIIDAIRNGVYDIRTTVALSKEPEKKPQVNPADSSGRHAGIQCAVAWEKYTPNARRAKVSVMQDGFLRISEVYYPGWEMLIDNVKTKIYQADCAWMAIPITKGEHTIDMFPRSYYLKTAEMISFPLMMIFGVYWIGFVAFRYLRNKTGPNANSKAARA
jgi:hypothetical protein